MRTKVVSMMVVSKCRWALVCLVFIMGNFNILYDDALGSYLKIVWNTRLEKNKN